MADLLLADAKGRASVAPELWKLDSDPRQKILSTLRAEMGVETPAARQQWLVAENGRTILGVTHSILLPIPPIYAGELGPPGLIMEDCCISPCAPPETRTELFLAAQADLIEAGARLLLASSVADGDWLDEYARQGFAPVTLYFSKSGLNGSRELPHVRPANQDDLSDIVFSSAVNRRVLERLHPSFWKPHIDADARFSGWMKHCMTLPDRDMFVSDDVGTIRGYALSQPATRLHFPAPHDISSTGIIDDYFHRDFEHAECASPVSHSAFELLEAAEAARRRRGDTSVLVVCPAAWKSKIGLLQEAGYSNAITWFIKIMG